MPIITFLITSFFIPIKFYKTSSFEIFNKNKRIIVVFFDKMIFVYLVVWNFIGHFKRKFISINKICYCWSKRYLLYQYLSAKPLETKYRTHILEFLSAGSTLAFSDVFGLRTRPVDDCHRLWLPVRSPMVRPQRRVTTFSVSVVARR